MTLKYKWNGTRSHLIVLRGEPSAVCLTNVTADLSYNMCDLEIKKRHESQATFTYDTNFGVVRFSMLLSMQRRLYNQMANGIEPSEQYVWEAHNVKVKAVEVGLPTGYTMEAQPYFKQMTTRTKKDSTFPIFYMDLEVRVGPMIGSWTKYMHRITWDPRRPKILAN